MSKNAYFNVCKDPWDAAPAGLPDMYESHTVPLKIKASYLINTLADGTFCIAFHPAINTGSGFGFSALGASTTGNLTAFTQSNHPDAASINSQFAAWRPISLGVKAFYLGAEGTSAGSLTIGHNDYLGATTAGISGNVPTAVADWADLPNAAAQAVAALVEPTVGAVRAFDTALFQGLQTAFCTTFPTVWVTGTNMPATLTAAVRIETSFNIEAIPLYGNNLTAHLQSVTVPDINGVMDVHRKLGVVRTGPFSKVMKSNNSGSGSGTSGRRKKSYKKKGKRKRSYKRSSATILMQPVKGHRVAPPMSRKRARTDGPAGYVRY